MISELDAVTNALGRLALDQAWMRQQVIASNIANHATPGYRTARLDFENVLTEVDKALQTGLSEPAALERIEAARSSMQPRSTDEPVALDQEMVALTKNSLHYLATLAALEKYGSLKGIAIRGESR